MDTKSSSTPSPLPKGAFSLRALFLFVTCASVLFAVIKLAGLVLGIASSGVWVFGFLTFWFFETGQLLRAKNAIKRLFYSIAIFIAIGLFLLTVSSSSDPSRLPVCSNNLRAIGLALLNYHQQYGSFPPAYVSDASGKPLYSWRVLILPFIDEQSVYAKFHLDQAWDSPENLKVLQVRPAFFHCPNNGSAGDLATDYVAVVGPNTAWPGPTGRKLSEFKHPSQTILAVETLNSGIQWTEPRDLYVGQLAPGINPKSGQGVSSPHVGGANTVLADGSLHMLGDELDPRRLSELLKIDSDVDTVDW